MGHSLTCIEYKEKIVSEIASLMKAYEKKTLNKVFNSVKFSA